LSVKELNFDSSKNSNEKLKGDIKLIEHEVKEGNYDNENDIKF